jgi:hypothetical protein
VPGLQKKLNQSAPHEPFGPTRRTGFLALFDEFDHIKDRFNNSTLEIVAAFVSQDAREKSQHDTLFRGKLEAESADGVDYDDLEIIRDFGHEGRDLLHEPIYGGLGTGLVFIL